MKAWEMIKELTENPKKKFVSKTSIPTTAILEDGFIEFFDLLGNRFSHGTNVNIEWEEVKQPVSFMEAFKALRSDCKNIYCMNGKSRFDFTGERIGAHVFDEDLIGEGKWYIED